MYLINFDSYLLLFLSQFFSHFFLFSLTMGCMRCKIVVSNIFIILFLNLYLTDFQYFILKFVKLFLSHIIIGKHYTKLQYGSG